MGRKLVAVEHSRIWHKVGIESKWGHYQCQKWGKGLFLEFQVRRWRCSFRYREEGRIVQGDWLFSLLRSSSCWKIFCLFSWRGRSFGLWRGLVLSPLGLDRGLRFRSKLGLLLPFGWVRYTGLACWRPPMMPLFFYLKILFKKRNRVIIWIKSYILNSKIVSLLLLMRYVYIHKNIVKCLWPHV